LQIIPLEGEAFFISAIIFILGAGFFFSLLKNPNGGGDFKDFLTKWSIPKLSFKF